MSHKAQTDASKSGESSVLYMNWWSPPSRAVMMVAAAIEKPLDLVIVKVVEGDHMKPEFLAKNPQHVIPMLEEGEFRVWDSHAIMPYLVGAYAKNDDLYPKDLRRRAIIDQRMNFDCSVLFPNFLAMILPVFQKEETEITKKTMDKVEAGFEILNKFLDGQSWLAGDTLTVADFACLATITTYYELIPDSIKKFSNIYNWMEKCKKVLPFYEEKNGKGSADIGTFLRNALGIKA